MSLAQRVEHPPILGSESSLIASGAGRTAVPLDFRDITRRATSAPHVLVVKNDPLPERRRESDIAFDLLNEVSRAVPALVERCERLDVEMTQIREQARLEIEASNEVAREWQQIASALKLQVEGLEKGFKAMKQRAEAAEQQIVDLRDTADKSQHAAAEAECLSSLFQEKVIASFGKGSVLHPLLETFRSRPPASA